MNKETQKRINALSKFLDISSNEIEFTANESINHSSYPFATPIGNYFVVDKDEIEELHLKTTEFILYEEADKHDFNRFFTRNELVSIIISHSDTDRKILNCDKADIVSYILYNTVDFDIEKASDIISKKFGYGLILAIDGKVNFQDNYYIFLVQYGDNRNIN